MFPELTRPPRAERAGIPRYVEGHYADSFGEQWNLYKRVQLDSANGTSVSHDRFWSNSGWIREELDREQVLEVGCGAGRFTEVVLETGAWLTAVDASTAVDACAANMAAHERLRLVQADLFDLPFALGSFDRAFCYGVVQHTPDPRAAFLAVVRMVRSGGYVSADVYRVAPYIDRWSSKYLWRPLTTRMPRTLLRRLIEWYVPHWLPIDSRLARVPKVGRFLTAVVPCWNYQGLFDLTPDQMREWAVLDTFDALSPRYDRPQTLDAVRAWCDEAGLVDVDVRPGGNGILVNARVV